MNNKSEYLGDGVYALWDGYHIVLSTLEGNTIYLEDTVMDALFEFFNKKCEES